MKCYIVIIIFYAASFLSSCDTIDVQSTNYPHIIDSNLFVWSFDTLQITHLEDMYVADTNCILIPGLEYSALIKDGSINYISHNDADFWNNCVNGLSSDNVYFGGSSRITRTPKLKHWNGFSLSDIPMPSDTNRITKIEIMSDKDIWISTTNNIIYHLENNVITPWHFEDSLTTGIVFKSNSNELFSHFIKYKSGGPNCIYMFKFVSNNWQFVNKQITDVNGDVKYFIGFCDNKMLYAGNSVIKYFTSSVWDNYINTSSLLYTLKAGGSSIDSLLILGSTNRQYDDVFYYNGENLYRSPYYHFPLTAIQNIQLKFNRFYLLIGDGSEQESFLGIGRFRN